MINLTDLKFKPRGQAYYEGSAKSRAGIRGELHTDNYEVARNWVKDQSRNDQINEITVTVSPEKKDEYQLSAKKNGKGWEIEKVTDEDILAGQGVNDE